MAKPTAGKGKSSIDTQFLPDLEDESLVFDEKNNPIGVYGSSGLPGPLANKEIKIAEKPKDASKETA